MGLGDFKCKWNSLVRAIIAKSWVTINSNKLGLSYVTKITKFQIKKISWKFL